MSMSTMGHDDPKPSLAELFNPAKWGLMGWAWVMLFVVAGAGIFVIVYQSRVAPEASQVRRSSSTVTRAHAAGDVPQGEQYKHHPEAYRSRGRGRGTGSGSSTGSNQGRSEGDWDRSLDPKAEETAQFPKVFSGEHHNRTTAFKAPGTIRVQWITTGPIFQLFVKKSGGGLAGPPVVQSGLSGISSGEVRVDVEGEVYFKVNSLGSWELTVDAVRAS